MVVENSVSGLTGWSACCILEEVKEIG